MKKTIFALALVMALALPQMLQAQADNPGTGTRWATPVSGVSSLELTGVVYGNNKYVVVGGPVQGGRYANIYYSTDSLNWTMVPTGSLPNANQFTGVAFGAGVFIAVGWDGVMAQSKDGATWTQISNPFGKDAINAIAFGNNMFVAVGEKGKVVYAAASDPTKWTTVANSTFGNSEISALTYYSGTFYAGTLDGKMAYSAGDIKKWTSANSPVKNAVMGIAAAGGGSWVAVGQFGILYASGGSNWKQVVQTRDFGESFNCVTYANGRYIAGGGRTGQIVWSTDGTSWKLSRDRDMTINISTGAMSAAGGIKGGETHINCILWANNKFTAVGHPAVLMHSY